MKIEKWVQDSAGRLDAVVLLDAGEKPSTVQVLEFVDRQAGAEKIWLLGRATLQRKENRVLVRTCVLPAMELPQLEGRTAEYRLKPPTDAQVEQQLQALARTRVETSEDEKPARAATRGLAGAQIDRMQLRQRLCVEKGMRYVTERMALKPAKISIT